MYWLNIPQWARSFSITRFLDHTQRRTTVGRIPTDEWSARRRDLYLTHNTHNKHPCPRWDSNPQSQQASGRRPTVRPRGHWDRLHIHISTQIILLTYCTEQSPSWEANRSSASQESIVFTSYKTAPHNRNTPNAVTGPLISWRWAYDARNMLRMS